MARKRIPIPPRLRYDVLRRDGFRCQYCGSSPQQDELHVDHVRPVARGGTNDMWNLRTACGRCNRGKGTLGTWPPGIVFEAHPVGDSPQSWWDDANDEAAWLDLLRETAEWEPVL